YFQLPGTLKSYFHSESLVRFILLTQKARARLSNAQTETMPSTHKKEKPWDTVDIDKWEFDTFTAKDNAGGTFTEESSFVTPFHRGCT
ncbi:hypothetical protein E4U28_005471, partial [Claviceps purpurea]